MAEAEDQKFLEFVVKSLVDHPEDVKIERKVDEMGVLLTLKVNSEDMGQVIGRSGSTARAVRTLIRILGLKHHARVNLKIEEPEGGRVMGRREENHSEKKAEEKTEEKAEEKAEEKVEEKVEEEIEEKKEEEKGSDLDDLDLS